MPPSHPPLYRRLDTPQGQSEQVQKISPPPGFDTQTLQSVASRYTKYAIPAHNTFLVPLQYNVLIYTLKLGD